MTLCTHAFYPIHHVLTIVTTSCVKLLHLQLAKAEKLKPMELELRKLEDLADAIVQDFAYMRAREEEMRNTNGRLFQHRSML